MMKTVFVISPSDIDQFQAKVGNHLRDEYSRCSSLTEVGILRSADAVYFVISGASMCSTAYQELVSAAMALCEFQKCSVLRLERTGIPPGFFMLQSLPERFPK